MAEEGKAEVLDKVQALDNERGWSKMGWKVRVTPKGDMVLDIPEEQMVLLDYPSERELVVGNVHD